MALPWCGVLTHVRMTGAQLLCDLPGWRVP